MKLDELKSAHINFTNTRITIQPVFINDIQLTYVNTAKYSGMTLDAKFEWKQHIKKKTRCTQHKFRKTYWVLGRKFELSTYNKVILYKQLLQPVYLWNTAAGIIF